MSERIVNEDGYISHVIISSTSDNKMFRTEFHTSDNSGVELPDYCKDEKSSLQTDRHMVVKNICNFLVYVRNHMKCKNLRSYKKVTISDFEHKKEFSIYVHGGKSISSLFEAVNEKLPKNFRNKSYFCSLRPTDTWFQVAIW